MSNISKLAWFAGGVLFGTAGLKLLRTQEARNVMVKAAAAGLRVKDSVMDTVTVVQENAADILASAVDYNAEQDAKKAAAAADAEIADASIETAEAEPNA